MHLYKGFDVTNEGGRSEQKEDDEEKSSERDRVILFRFVLRILRFTMLFRSLARIGSRENHV